MVNSITNSVMTRYIGLHYWAESSLGEMVHWIYQTAAKIMIKRFGDANT